MKNQYFGDINDYRKYGLLRILGCYGQFRIGICWMLTPDDGSKEGRHIGYLDADKSERWSVCDPTLYASLKQAVQINATRDVNYVESAALIPSAQFHTQYLTDNVQERQAYFTTMFNTFAGIPLIFFDPDNGLEVPSVKRGRRKSSKYLYWTEVVDAYRRDHSLLIYQHFPRMQHAAFIEKKASKLREMIGAAEICTFRTAYTVFFLVVHPDHTQMLGGQEQVVFERWKGQFGICRFNHDSFSPECLA